MNSKVSFEKNYIVVDGMCYPKNNFQAMSDTVRYWAVCDYIKHSAKVVFSIRLCIAGKDIDIDFSRKFYPEKKRLFIFKPQCPIEYHTVVNDIIPNPCKYSAKDIAGMCNCEKEYEQAEKCLIDMKKYFFGK